MTPHSSRALSSAASSSALVTAGVEDHSPTPRPGAVRLSMLGGFACSCGGTERTLAPGVQRLVAFVALQQRPVQRAYVAGQLRMDASEQHALASLRTTLWRAQLTARDLLDVTTTHIGLGHEVCVDVRDAMNSAHAVLRGTGALSADDLACLLLTGDLLPGWYDDWLVIERERVRQLRCLALEAFSDRCRRAGRHADATQAGLAAVAAEPLRESAHRAVIRAHLAAGNAVDAIRQYRILSLLLRRELALAPSPETRSLMQCASAR